MPLIDVQLSTKLSHQTLAVLMQNLSQSVASRLGKPESYVMVILRSEVPMLMGGRAEPSAWAEVRSVGSISPAQARELSAAVSQALAKAAGIDESRVYCTFQGVPGALWGQGDQTFG